METSSRRGRTVLYVVALGLLVVLAIIGLLRFSAAQETQRAQEKADVLIAAIEAAGATAPSREQIMRVLGDDGGAVCENPNDALSRAIFLGQLVNGAGGPGARPVIADNRVVKGQLLIMGVYCPQELAGFQEFVDTLKLSDVAGG